MRGVRWQVIREEKRQEKDKCLGILENLKYTLDRNLEINNDNGIYYLFSYTIEDWWVSNYKKEFYLTFSENIFKNKYEENINSENIMLKNYFEWLNIFSEFLYNLSLPLFILIRSGDCSYFKGKVIEKLEEIKKYYGSSYFKEVNKDEIDKVFNNKKNDIKEKVIRLVELINYTAIRLTEEIKSNDFRNKIETNIDELYFYAVSEQDLINDLEYINNEIKNLKEKIEAEIEEYKK